VQVKKARKQVTTGTPEHAGLPCAIGFNGLCRTLPGVPGLLAPVVIGLIRRVGPARADITDLIT